MTTGTRSRGFRAYLATQFLGAFNDNAYRFTFLFYVFAAVPEEGAQGRWKGLAQVLFALPFIVFAALAGSLADRCGKGAVIRWAKAAEIAVMLAGLLAFGADSLPALAAVLFCMAAQSAFFGPAKYGYLAETLVEGELVRANALVQLTTMVAIVAGQLMGGLVYDAHADDLATGALWFVGFAVLGTATSLAVPALPAAQPGRRLVLNPWPDLAGTWAGVRADRTLLYTMLGNAHYFLLVAALQVNLAEFGEEGLGFTERTGAAALVATATAGLGLGSLLASRWSLGRVELGLVPLGALAMTAGLVLMALVEPLPLGSAALAGPDATPLQRVASALLREGLWTHFAAALVLGVAGGIYVVPIWSLLQQEAPEREKGRYLAFGNLVGFLGMAVSALVLWLPGEWGWSHRARFLLLAGLALAGTLVSLRLLPYAFVRLLGWLLAHTLYRIRVVDAERLPARGGALLLVNHVSWVDALVLGVSTRRRVHFLMYRRYYEWWPTHWLFRLLGCIPVASGDHPDVTARSLQDAGALLDEGRVLAVFGEGAVTRLGHLLPFRTGFQRIVQGRSAPLVPVYLHGLWGSVLSHAGGRFLRRLPSLAPRRVTVAIGESLPAGTSPAAARAALAALAARTWAGQERPALLAAFARGARRDLRPSVGDERGGRVSPAGLLARSAALARALERVLPPVGEAPRVAVAARPGTDAAALVLALLRNGRTPVLLDPAWDDGTARRAAADAGAGAALRLDPGVLGGLPRRSMLPALAAGLLRGAWPSGRGPAAGAREAAVVFDEARRPLVLTQDQVGAAVEGLQQVLELSRRDVVLSLLPWSSGAGLITGLWLPLLADLGAAWWGGGESSDPADLRNLGRLAEASAASVVFLDAVQAARCVAGLRPEALGGVVQAFGVVAGSSRPPLRPESAPPGTPGDGLDDALQAAFQARFGLALSPAWSPPGCAGLATLNIPDVRLPGVFQRGTRAGSVGHPIPGLSVRAWDDALREELPAGRAGRLRLSGPAAGAALLEVTGLSGRVDEEGFVSLESAAG